MLLEEKHEQQSVQRGGCLHVHKHTQVLIVGQHMLFWRLVAIYN